MWKQLVGVIWCTVTLFGGSLYDVLFLFFFSIHNISVANTVLWFLFKICQENTWSSWNQFSVEVVSSSLPTEFLIRYLWTVRLCISLNKLDSFYWICKSHSRQFRKTPLFCICWYSLHRSWLLRTPTNETTR